MEQKLFSAGMSKNAIKDSLEGMAVKVENDQEYHRPITDDEIFILKDTLAESSIKQVALTEKLEVIKEEYKNALAPLKQQWRETVESLKTRTVKIESGTLYMIPDYESKQMGFYDEDGNLIRSRMMLAEERKMMRIEQGADVLRSVNY